jgi:hypothetical protein
VRSKLTQSDQNHLRNALRDMQAFLLKNTHLDPGGQCKERIGKLLQ